MEDKIYLTMYLKQSCGWVKICEAPCTSQADADRVEKELRKDLKAGDEVRFSRRGD